MESIAIIVCSAAMLAYWFRFTCSLLLQQYLQVRDGAPGDGTQRVACTQLSARSLTAEELDAFLVSLNADYRMVNYLLGQINTALPGAIRHLLGADYRLLRLWCGVLKRVSMKRAQVAAGEMALVVACLGLAIEPARSNA